ncbi:MAG: hypothetical protein FWC46_06785, partial [Actinomycetia bacterium]|nr:hypothetical protein [Actinomycetes bacterium]
MALANTIGQAVVRIAPLAAPRPIGAALRAILNAAINGVGSVPGARVAAGRRLARHGGDHEATIQAIIAQHALAGGVGGFVTNLGGVVVL